MTSLLWLLLGLILGFVIGALAPSRDNSFIINIQKTLKKGQKFTFSISRFDHDMEDDDDGDDGFKPPFLPKSERYESN